MSQPKSSRPKSSAEAEQRAVSIAGQWAGPLPPPAALEHFERIAPGAAERVLRMAEQEQGHRHAIEAAAMHTQQETVRLTARDNIVGMVLGFLALAGSLAAAVWSVTANAPWPVSLGFIGLPVTIVVVELVRRKR